MAAWHSISFPHPKHLKKRPNTCRDRLVAGSTWGTAEPENARGPGGAEEVLGIRILPRRPSKFKTCSTLSRRICTPDNVLERGVRRLEVSGSVILRLAVSPQNYSCDLYVVAVAAAVPGTITAAKTTTSGPPKFLSI